MTAPGCLGPLDRRIPLILLAASVAILGAAFAFEHLGGLAPCELCWWQRYVYMAAIPVALFTLALDRPGRPTATWPPKAWTQALLAALALLFLAGALLAGYHVGVEQKWWAGPATCSAAPLAGNFDQLFHSLMQAPITRCDDIAWSLFGISMAGYNGLLSLALAGLSLRGMWSRWRANR